MTLESTTPTISIDQLRDAVRGRVITADDADYEAARAIMYQGPDARPAAIVRVADAGDVSTVVSIARETGTDLAVRSGGHSAAGHSSTDGGIVIDLRDLDSLDIDVAGRTAWAGSGLTAGEYTAKAAEHGLATGFGDTGSVGLGGLTTGGGVGYLVRKHGLTIDNLLAAEIVTADGQVRIVDADNEPDLFWAIRGGGGNFGVATRFRYRLSELQGVVGGMLVLPATADTVAGFIAAAEAAPDEVSTIANVMSCPPMPFVPEQYHGTIVILGMLAYAGDEAAGQRRSPHSVPWPSPWQTCSHPSPTRRCSRPTIPTTTRPPSRGRCSSTTSTAPVAKTIVDFLEASDASMRVAQLRVLGGAAARVPVDATAYAHRASRIMVNVAAFYEGEEDKPRREAWVAEFSSALQQGDAGAYVNFVGDEGETRVRAAYPGSTWDRLTTTKRRYDPDNVFRRNQNIPPAAAGAATT